MQISIRSFVVFSAILAGCAGVAALLGGGMAFALIGIPTLMAVFAIVMGEVSPVEIPRTVASKDPAPALPLGFGRTLLQKMPAPLMLISSTGRMTYANPAAIEILPGYQPGIPYTTVLRAPAFVETVNSVLTTGRDSSVEFSAHQNRDRVFLARVSLLPAGGEFGEELQAIVQLEDRSKDMLAMRARTDFVANASHELRTPLASILGYIETLQGHAKDDPEAQERFLKIMSSQAERMQRLVEDLMSLSRIEMSSHQAPGDKLDLMPLVREASATLQSLANQAEVDLRIDLKSLDGASKVRGDRDQLTQVIVNLVANALKYTSKGGAVNVFRAKPNPSYPGQIGFSVEDTGIGIPREHLPRLTERFYRVNAVQSREKGGTGLGLAITKHILNRHSGALDIQSEVGKGSRFTVWLPVVKDAGEDSAEDLRAAE